MVISTRSRSFPLNSPCLQLLPTPLTARSRHPINLHHYHIRTCAAVCLQHLLARVPVPLLPHQLWSTLPPLLVVPDSAYTSTRTLSRALTSIVIRLPRLSHPLSSRSRATELDNQSTRSGISTLKRTGNDDNGKMRRGWQS